MSQTLGIMAFFIVLNTSLSVYFCGLQAGLRRGAIFTGIYVSVILAIHSLFGLL